jgi:hypothetical protein
METMGDKYKIEHIDVISNICVWEKFYSEIERFKKKYPFKSIDELVKFLFHGSKQTDPEMIYNGEDGFDMRFANLHGAYGAGTYFAPLASTSHSYTHPVTC